MKIAVRLDDITPDMDWGRFLRFKTLLDRYQVKPLIGVVPKNQDENLKKNAGTSGACDSREGYKEETGEQGKPADFWEYIKNLEKDGWTLAMHGCYHVYATNKGGVFPLNNFSEFAGLPLEKQKEMLLEGKRILREKGIETDIFMAPAHSYDNNTLKALKETGFEALTDGFGDMPYIWKNLKFYPISFRLSSTFKKKRGYSTMVVHTGTVSEEDLVRYEGYFKRKDVQWIAFKEYLEQNALKRSIFGRWKEFLMAKVKHLLVKSRSR